MKDVVAQDEKVLELKEVQGGALSAIDRFWLETVRELAGHSIGAIEKSAKQIISLVTLLQAIYFAAITFSSIKTMLAGLAGTLALWALALSMCIPLVCWIVSLWLSVLVFIPEIYQTNLSSPDLARDTYLEIAQYKHKRLMQSYTALAAGFVPLLIAILIFLLY